MSLMDGGDKFETRKVKLVVKKPGISSFIFSFAHKFSFIYGIFSAIIAIGLGVFASVVLEKLVMDKELVFLVVLDDSDEVLNALRYASQRSSINKGRVALLYTFETP